jgi:hypothetical protein
MEDRMLIGRELRQPVFNTGSQVKLLATADNVICEGFEGGRISLPVKVWRLVDRVKRDTQDPTLSDTIRVLLLQQLAENSYLEDREKKALGVTA